MSQRKGIPGRCENRLHWKLFSHMTLHFSFANFSTFEKRGKLDDECVWEKFPSTKKDNFRDRFDVDKENASRKSKYWPAVIKTPWEVENPSEMNLSTVRHNIKQRSCWRWCSRDRHTSSCVATRKLPGASVLVRELSSFLPLSPLRVTYPHTPYTIAHTFVSQATPQFSGHFWFYFSFSAACLRSKHKSRKEKHHTVT